jgi:phage terminase large subunit-like protein
LNQHVATGRFHLNPGQVRARELLAGPQRSTLLVGGSRSGKTFLFMRAIIIRALRAPGSRHLVTRFRFNATRASIWLDTFPRVMHKCFPGITAHDNRQDGFADLPGGSQIWFGGLDEKERVEKILGLEFATLFFNEASQIPYSSYLIARTRLAQVCQIAGSNETLPQREYVDLNPGGSGHWTYRQYIQKLIPTTRRPLSDPDEYAYTVLHPSENAENLDDKYIPSLEAMPERQRKRFLEGVYQPEVEGALWTFEIIEAARFDTQVAFISGEAVEILQRTEGLPHFTRVVVAVDPSGTHGDEDKRSDDVGIIVAGRGQDGRAYIIADLTCKLPPAGWAAVACNAYHAYKADRIVAEINFGGAMVMANIKAHDPYVPVVEVTASRGKSVRAEPASNLYAQGKVKHVGQFVDLEDQLLNFSTAGYIGDGSPDRADAMVWAIFDLMLIEEPPLLISDEVMAMAALSSRSRRRY